MKSFAAAVTACAAVIATFAFPTSASTITSSPWGRSSTGEAVKLYTLTNDHGMRATITNFGGIVTSLLVPDKHGKFADVVLGYDNLAQYVANVNNPYFGALIGRYGNRIGKAQFSLGGNTYHLAKNNDPNNLHGGPIGFDRRVWQARTEITKSGPALLLTLLSKDGDMGFPGNLHVAVEYIVGNDNSLIVEYRATTDKDTVVNLTHHSYFNLAGAGNGTILNHIVTINADRYTPIDATSIPLGPLESVAGTPFDFRKPTAIGKRIDDKSEQLTNGKGYDHNFVLNRHRSGDVEYAATVVDPVSGRTMQVSTTEPGLQFYTGNYLNGTNIGKGRKVYQKHYGFCMEAQHYPDSPNEPTYPSTLLKPGQVYHQTTIYSFGRPARPRVPLAAGPSPAFGHTAHASPPCKDAEAPSRTGLM